MRMAWDENVQKRDQTAREPAPLSQCWPRWYSEGASSLQFTIFWDPPLRVDAQTLLLTRASCIGKNRDQSKG